MMEDVNGPDSDDQLNHISASEDEDDERKHSQLIDAITTLDGKKNPRKSQRTVPTSQISEYNFNTSGGKAKVKLHELVGTLKDSVSHGELKKQLRTVEKRNKVVSAPLPKLEKERIERSIAYTNTSKELTKWDPVVEKNRKAEQIIYPLEQPSLKLHTTDQFVKRFKPTTPLEVEIAALLQGSQHIHSKDKELTPAEEKALKVMSLQEAKERRAELQKYRALLSYKEAKARWQSKIKSKRYHRVLRKEKLKHEKKALEELQKKDPGAYLEKLNSIKQQHIQERMSLKHRGGSKFAKKQMIYSKFDDQARQAVQDMLQKSKELTKKNEIESDSDDDGVSIESDNEAGGEFTVKPNKNPWMSTVKIPKLKSSDYKRPEALQNEEAQNSDDGDFENDEYGSHLKDSLVIDDTEDSDGDERKKNDDQIDRIFEKASKKTDQKKILNKKADKQLDVEGNTADKKRKKGSAKNKMSIIVGNKQENLKGTEKLKDEIDYSDDNDDDEELISETLTRKQTLAEIEGDSSEQEEIEIDIPSGKKESVSAESNKNKRTNTKSDEVFVDPKKIFTLESKLKLSSTPDLVVSDDNDVDPDEEQRMTIAQAFADDDVIDEFTQEKKGVMDRDKPKDIDLTLPGWGDWGGAGIKVSKKKKRRFIIKAPPAAPRKDDKLGNVIISELKDSAIRKHQVNNLPFPYANVKQFEQSIRAPIGKTWNPETAYKQLVKPKVVTKLGAVISPIDKTEVFKKQKATGKRKPDFSFDTTEEKKVKQNPKKKKKSKSGNKKK